MLNKSDVEMVTILKNIHYHMEKEYDFFLIVFGDTGTGKSRLILNLMETWYRVILKKPVTEDMISHVNQNYGEWLKRFKTLKAFDMNIFDEGSTALSSIDFMTRISKDIVKLFDVCRCKQFFSVVVLPSYFRLNKALREDRLRGLIWVDKRGHYKLYSKENIKRINAYNENRKLKNPAVVKAHHQTMFPDYKGVMLAPYLKQKNEGVEDVLDEVILAHQKRVEKKSKPIKSLIDIYKKQVLGFKKKGLTNKEISEELSISTTTVQRCLHN